MKSSQHYTVAQNEIKVFNTILWHKVIKSSALHCGTTKEESESNYSEVSTLDELPYLKITLKKLFSTML